MSENSSIDIQLENTNIASFSVKLSGLENLFSILSRDMPFEEVIREILASSMKIIPCEAGSILELDYRTNDLFFRSAIGTVADKLKIFRIPLGVGAAGFVAQNKSSLNLTNAQENKIHLKSISNSIGYEVKNMICVPILIKGKTYGVLELINRVGDYNFSTDDLELLNDFAIKAGSVIELKIRLHSLEKKIKELANANKSQH